MEAISKMIAFGALAWNYCSIRCYQNAVAASHEAIQHIINECPHCSAANRHTQPAQSSALNSGDGICDQACGSSSTTSDSCQGPSCKRCRAGKITNNPFFNYLRTVRPHHCGQKQTELVIQAAQEWKKMTSEEKRKYTKKAILAVQRSQTQQHGSQKQQHGGSCNQRKCN